MIHTVVETLRPQINSQDNTSHRSCNKWKKSKMKARKILRHPVFLASLLYLSLSSVKGDKHCFVVPKVCDIYDGGYAIEDGTKYRKCISRADTKDPNLLNKVPAPVRSDGTEMSVCKVPVGVGKAGSTSWWTTCDDNCYEPGTNFQFLIDCPEDPSKEGAVGCADDAPRCMQDCETKCQFPFFHNGVEYNTCTMAGDSRGDGREFLWCATEVDATGHWTMRAECECFDSDAPIKAKAANSKSEANVFMDVTFTQNKLKNGRTTYEGTVSGLDPNSEYDLTVFQATDSGDDCASTRGPHFNPSQSSDHVNMIDGHNGDLQIKLKADSGGWSNFTGAVNNIMASLFDDVNDCPDKTTLLRRVLVVHQGDTKKACATINLLPPQENPLATILIIIFCIIIIIAIIAAIIIYCCYRIKRGKPETPPEPGKNQKPEGSQKPEEEAILIPKNPYEGIPWADGSVKDDRGSIDDLDRRLFVETHYAQTTQSQESISSDSYTSDELI